MMILFLISAVFFCGTASFPHGSSPQSAGILIKGPGSSAVVRGPDGSVITADFVGGLVSVEDSVVLGIPGDSGSLSPGNSEIPLPVDVEPIVPGTSKTPSPGAVEPLVPGTSETPTPGNTEPPGTAESPQPTSESPENSSESNGETDETPEINLTTSKQGSSTSTSTPDVKDVEPSNELPLASPEGEVELEGRLGQILVTDLGLTNNNRKEVQATAEKLQGVHKVKGPEQPLEKLVVEHGLQQLYGNSGLVQLIVPGFSILW